MWYLCKLCWMKDVAPSNWIKSMIVPSTKERMRGECKNYRDISLLNVAGKLFGKIVIERVKRVIDMSIRCSMWLQKWKRMCGPDFLNVYGCGEVSL